MQQFCRSWRLRYNRRIILNYRIIAFILVQNLSFSGLNNFCLLRSPQKRVDWWQVRLTKLQRFLLRKSTIRDLFYF
jgi:hypothetical protein